MGQISKSKFFNTTVHNINNARVVITNNNRRKMSMDMWGHESMDNNISSIFTEDNLGLVEKGSIISITEDKVGMVEKEEEEVSTINNTSGSKMKSDQNLKQFGHSGGDSGWRWGNSGAGMGGKVIELAENA